MVDFGAVIAWKLPLLQKAFEAFARSTDADRQEFETFCQRHASWLDEYALFMALKDAHDLVSWTEWEPELALRRAGGVQSARETARDDIECNKFIQFEFERQWCDLKAHCTRNDIRIMGDLPIYVALDSADVWANRELFELGEDGKPRVVAGVPPDYFSATGQLWGNPIYRWEEHAKSGYAWWIARFRRALEMLDMIRLDHFRGFEAYYEIPAGEVTAVNGAWVKGPGAALFEALRSALGDLPIVAENLGVITPEVEGPAQPVRLSRHGDSAICFRQRSPGARLQAAQLSASAGRLHRHARQRHRRRLVEQQGRRRQHSHRRRRGKGNGVRAPLSQHRRQRHQLGDDSHADGVGRRHRSVSACRMCWASAAKAA